MELEPPSQRLKRDAADALAAGDTDAAIQILTSAIHACPQQDSELLATLYCNRSACHAEAQAHTQALVDARMACRHRPSWHKPFLRQALALAGLERYEEAVQALTTGIAAIQAVLAAQLMGYGTAAACLAADVARAAGADQQQQILSMEVGGSGLGTVVAAAGAIGAVGAAGPHAAQQASDAAARPRGAAGASHQQQEALEEGLQELLEAQDALCAASAASRAAKRRRLQQRAALGERTALDPASEAVRILQAAGVKPESSGKGGVPVTVASGFLGAGKTTLLRHLLTQLGGGEGYGVEGQRQRQHNTLVGVLVNDLASVNIDAGLLAGTLPDLQPLQGNGGALAHSPPLGTTPHEDPAPEVVELSNGCICCNLRGDLLLAVARLLASRPTLGLLLVEATGVGDPMPVAATLQALEGYVRVDTLVTVLDVAQFDREMSMGLAASSHVKQGVHDGPEAAAAATGGRFQQPEAGSFVSEVRPTTAAPKLSVHGGASNASNASNARDVPAATAATAAPAAAAGGLLEEGGAAAAATAVAGEGAPRPLAELLTRQVEYANVVILNKCDLVSTCPPHHRISQPLLRATSAPSSSASAVERVHAAVCALAPSARVLRSVRCEVAPSQVLRTGLFDAQRMEESARWQRELLEAEGLPSSTSEAAAAAGAATEAAGAASGRGGEGKPEAQTQVADYAPGSTAAHRAPTGEEAEFGIRSFVFRARRPFHPLRLWRLLLRGGHAEGSADGAGSGSADGSGAGGNGSAASGSRGRDGEAVQKTPPLRSADLHDGGRTAADGAADVAPATVSAAPAHVTPPSGLPLGLLRSKGFFWVAGLPEVAWEWSTAGAPHAAGVGGIAAAEAATAAGVVEANGVAGEAAAGAGEAADGAREVPGAGAWRFAPYGEWMAPRLPRRLWPLDRPGWDRDWGDRKQVLVFIGRGLDEEALRGQLEACLVTADEAAELRAHEEDEAQAEESEGQEGEQEGARERVLRRWEAAAAPWRRMLEEGQDGVCEAGVCY